jgi:hypothetical protein
MRARFAGFVVPLVLALLLAGAMATPALARQKRSITVIKKVAAQHRLSKADTRALIVLAKRESGYNPRCVFNTAVAIKQIKARYKTPRRALAHSYSNGWY